MICPPVTLDGGFFFFSSRRRHTRYWRDWSSDVCSSDLRLRSSPTGDAELPVGGAASGGGAPPQATTVLVAAMSTAARTDLPTCRLTRRAPSETGTAPRCRPARPRCTSPWGRHRRLIAASRVTHGATRRFRPVRRAAHTEPRSYVPDGRPPGGRSARRDAGAPRGLSPPPRPPPPPRRGPPPDPGAQRHGQLQRG